MRHWYKWIPLYSKRTLTKSSDKLPAIAGIAFHIATTLGLNYVAGLWRKDLHLGLTWFAERPQTLIRHKSRAPSWSWASVDGAVVYPECLNITKYRARIRANGPHDLEVCDVIIDEDNPGTFGSVCGGRIEAVATLYEVKLENWGQGRVSGDLGGPNTFPLTCIIDEPGIVENSLVSKLYWAARICSISLPHAPMGPHRHGAQNFYLILKDIDGAFTRFRRIGLAEKQAPVSVTELLPGERKRITIL
jgi:hypothetical protein